MDMWCVLCFKETQNRGSFTVQEEQLLLRFFKQLETYLGNKTEKKECGQQPYQTFLDELISDGIMGACGDCLDVMSSFCNLIEQLKSVEDRLNWKLSTVKNVMGDEEDGKMEKLKKSKSWETYEELLENLVKFKTDLVETCSVRLQKLPAERLRRPPLEINDRDEDTPPVLQHYLSIPPNYVGQKQFHDEDESIMGEDEIPPMVADLVKIEPRWDSEGDDKEFIPDFQDQDSDSDYDWSKWAVEVDDDMNEDSDPLGEERKVDLANLNSTAKNSSKRVGTNRTRTCWICNKECKNTIDFWNHRKIVHGLEKASSYNKKIKCEQGNDVSTPSVCKVCKKTFSNYTNLYLHMKTIHQRTKYKCGYCSSVFSHPSNCNKHLRLHHVGSNGKPLPRKVEIFQDEIEDVIVKKEEVVQQNSDSDTTEIEMKQSNRVMTRGSNTKRAANKGYKCKHCGKQCPDQRRLRSHLTTAHPEANPVQRNHECDICGKKVTTGYYLKIHKETVHYGMRYECLFCKKTFPCPTGLSAHKNICPNKPDKVDTI